MADFKPAALSGAAATEFLAASERVKPHSATMPAVAFVLTRFLPAPRDVATA